MEAAKGRATAGQGAWPGVRFQAAVGASVEYGSRDKRERIIPPQRKLTANR